MKRTKSWRWLEKALFMVIISLSIVIVAVFVSRRVPIPTGPELFPAKTSGIGTITADGFTTVFILAENVSRAFNGYQVGLLGAVLISGVGIIGLAFVGVLLVLYWKPKRALYVVYPVMIIFAGVGALNIVTDTDGYRVRDCVRLQNIYDSQQYGITEGVVHVLHTEPAGGHEKGDIITIGNAEFEISYFWVTCGYAASINYGGVLKEGTYARVYYADSRTILRIDVKKQ